MTFHAYEDNEEGKVVDFDRRIASILLVSVLVGVFVLSAFFLTQAYPAWNISSRMSGLQGSLTMENASSLAENYLRSTGNDDLAIDEIMEFEFNFYVIYYEKSTGVGAFEAIIDKASSGGMMRMMGFGYVRPEQGPNMMWNTKYGMHTIMQTKNTVNVLHKNADDAKRCAQEYLDIHFPNAVADDVHPFYGYYTIHMLREGRVAGMLSVNGYTGQVWFHGWHGQYVQTREMHTN